MRKGPKSRRRADDPERRRKIFIVVGLTILALIVGVLWDRYESEDAWPAYGAAPASAATFAATSLPANDPLATQVAAVAGHFLCGCGECGDMKLVECDCNMPNGGINEKAFIRQKLTEGHNVDHVVEMVDAAYGRRLPTAGENALGTRSTAATSATAQNHVH